MRTKGIEHAPKVVILVHIFHPHLAVVAAAKSISGNDVRLVQLVHALAMSSEDERSSVEGKEVRDVQLFHAPLKVVPLETSSDGKEVSAVQLCHVLVKLVPESSPVARKDVIEVHPSHA